MELNQRAMERSHLEPTSTQNQNQENRSSVQHQSNNHHHRLSPLPAWARFYFYGMHGLLDEIVFTALFDLVFEPSGNPQLKGYSTISSFIIYGSCSFAMEQCFIYCMRRGYPRFLRVFLYVMGAYLWEFSFGLMLRQFDACSWDYSHYPLNLLGLITLVYAPGWYILGVLQDFQYHYLFSLQVGKKLSVEKLKQ